VTDGGGREFSQPGGVDLGALQRAVTRVSIVPDEEGGSLGHCAHPGLAKFSPDVDDGPRALRTAERQLLVLLAGLAAESKFAGRNYWRGAHEDLRAAHNVASYFEPGDAEALFVRLQLARARRLVGRPDAWDLVQRLAAALLERRTMSGREVRALLRQTQRATWEQGLAAAQRAIESGAVRVVRA
jgi:hypothetical protein